MKTNVVRTQKRTKVWIKELFMKQLNYTALELQWTGGKSVQCTSICHTQYNEV